jgi:hypothetical protein
MMVHHAHGVTADYKIDAYRLAGLGFNVLVPSLFNMFGLPGTNHIGQGADLQAMALLLGRQSRLPSSRQRRVPAALRRSHVAARHELPGASGVRGGARRRLRVALLGVSW